LTLHILSFVAWMAGILYLPRLFVYHHQAERGGEAEHHFVTMERRLLKGITTPAMIATWIFGLALLATFPHYAGEPWFLVKFACVLGISGIHGFYAASQKKFAGGERPRSERFWRLMNEAPFVLLIIIVIMVIVRPFAG
jgi:putative membrane protein